jgi:hypothetical protein
MGDDDQLPLLPARLPLRDASLGQPGTAARSGRAGPGPPSRSRARPRLRNGQRRDLSRQPGLGRGGGGLRPPGHRDRQGAGFRFRLLRRVHRGRRHPAARGGSGRPLRPRDRRRLLPRHTRRPAGRLPDRGGGGDRAGRRPLPGRRRRSSGGLAPARRARPQRRRPAAPLRRRLRPGRRADGGPGRAGRKVRSVPPGPQGSRGLLIPRLIPGLIPRSSRRGAPAAGRRARGDVRTPRSCAS